MARFDHFCELVTTGGEDRQRCPEIVEDTSAKGKSRFWQIKVGRYCDVGVEQIIGPFLVGHPRLVKKHGLPQQPPLLRQTARSDSHRHEFHLGIGRLPTHEKELQLRMALAEAGGCLDYRQRVKPFPDTTAPD